ncbi:MAG: gamma-glutamyltransferase [Myxococcales bacterium]|nr:MAG: gamma-glutamyltransferase [Myxococcales bacterium]
MKRLVSVLLWCVSALLIAGLAAGSPTAQPEHAAAFGRYAVAADHPEASKVGAEILAAGGNAADAAAATMLALGVVNPASSGLGGGGFALYYCAKDGSLTFLDFRERAPRAATRTMFELEGERPDGPANSPSQLGGLAAGVPGEPAGIEALVTGFGKLSLHEVVAPALRLAEDGFAVSDALAAMGSAFEIQLRKDPVMANWDLRPGATLRRPSLARVLRAFAEEGAAVIYGGVIGREMVAAVRKHGGIMTLDDLYAYRVRRREPLATTAFGYRWVTAPPPSAGGFTMIQSLSILEQAAGPTPASGAQLLHAMAESWKGPFLDRQRYFGDPDQVILPLEQMMDDSRIARRAGLADDDEAHPSAEYDFPVEWTRDAVATPDNAGTSHFCIVDEEGNVASVTTTVNLPFGARFTGGGIVMNDEMDDFASGIGKANAFGLVGGARNLPGPWKRPVSTMSPTIVLEKGKPALCVGASGGSRIVTATQQVAMNVLLHGMNAGEAVAAPRIHHQGIPDALRVEKVAPLDPALQDALRARGHQIKPIHNVATVQAIQIEHARERRLRAASDPRKGGRPAGH